MEQEVVLTKRVEPELRRGGVLVNHQNLLCNGKDYAEVVFFGDLHIGHPTCMMDKAKELLRWVCKNRVYVLLMGDLLEAGLTTSIGDSVYMQVLNPQEQMDEAISLLRPLAKGKLIVGLHTGNHELRIQKTTGLDVSKIMARELGVSYLGSACWNIFKVGQQSYCVYSLHGSTGSRFLYTKLKAATDISHYFPASDVVAMGHSHDVASIAVERQYINSRNKQIEYRKQYIILTGHYLGYKHSYSEQKGMPPAKMGSPAIKLDATGHDIHVRT